MAKRRKIYGATLKAKVAIAAVKEQKTVSQLDSHHKLHSKQVQALKRQLI